MSYKWSLCPTKQMLECGSSHTDLWHLQLTSWVILRGPKIWDSDHNSWAKLVLITNLASYPSHYMPQKGLRKHWNTVLFSWTSLSIKTEWFHCPLGWDKGTGNLPGLTLTLERSFKQWHACQFSQSLWGCVRFLISSWAWQLVGGSPRQCRPDVSLLSSPFCTMSGRFPTIL